MSTALSPTLSRASELFAAPGASQGRLHGMPKGFKAHASPCRASWLFLFLLAPVLTLTLVPGQTQSPHHSLSRQE